MNSRLFLQTIRTIMPVIMMTSPATAAPMMRVMSISDEPSVTLDRVLAGAAIGYRKKCEYCQIIVVLYIIKYQF